MDCINDCDRARKLELFEAANVWAKRGMAVFPLQPRSKIPFPGTRGCKEATRDEKQIREWWTRTPDANIGIATGNGLFVVDIDGEEAENWYINALGRHGGHPETLTTATARGWHMFYWSKAKIPNSAGLIAPHVDVRGTGGYVVGAPSIHPDGHVYKLVSKAEIAEAPNWLVDLALPDRPPPPSAAPSISLPHAELKERIGGLIRTVAAAPPGERNALLFWGACRAKELASGGIISQTQARGFLTDAALCCGLMPKEIEATIRSAFRGPGNGGK